MLRQPSDDEVPNALSVHLVLGHRATRSTPVVEIFLVAHPHGHLYSTRTNSSWLPLVVNFRRAHYQEAPSRHAPKRRLALT